MKAKEVVKKVVDEPVLYTEKCIKSKILFVILELLLFCLTFSIMFMIVVKQILKGITVMFSCNNTFSLSYLKLFFIGFITILVYILIITSILYLLNKTFRINLSFKKSLSIITSSYIYFTVSNIVSAILFLIGWGYLGYILILVIFFFTQYNVYKTYYSVVESHGKRFSIILIIIYCITSILTFIALNITLFDFFKTLYITVC